MINITDQEDLRTKLKDLRVEHRELDSQIAELSENPFVDTLRMKRLKKRKLLFKDMIVKLESKLIPDLNA